MKKILFTFSVVAVTLVTLPMFAAFEAHVINVTARIENALSVPVEEIHYGTVFPQEQLDRVFDVVLSESFQEEDRVDDVDYVIKQKPKCILVATNIQALAPYGRVTEDENGNFICEDEEHYDLMPLLCPYLSKHEITTDGQGENDSSGIPAFHGLPGPWTPQTTLATQVKGHLAKSDGDRDDRWNIDLKVPCFVGECSQDWDRYVLSVNDNVTPLDYIQPQENESKLFGCDLWLEVGRISLPGFQCEEEIDLMLVLDRSLSIDSTELATLKTAAHAFVDALAPNGGPHIGQVSFAPSATLDLHLSGATSTINAAIDALSTAGGTSTNLEDGILVASGELSDGDVHERPAVPDFMLIITDGDPNECNTLGCNATTSAAVAAAAAKVSSTEIFVVGVGATASNADFLRDNIASGMDHYFDAADFDDLEQVLEDLVACPDE